MGPELNQTADTTQKSTTHAFKIINTTNTTCAEKCESSSWVQKSINQELKIYYLVNVDHQGISSEVTMKGFN
jgi:hypothetical protein